MRTIFIDTSFYIAVANPKDERHSAALQTGCGHREQFITTEYVIVELGNYFHSPEDKGLFLKTLEIIESNPNINVIPASYRLLHEGVRLFRNRPDKYWSLTDCISFAAMRQYRITDALTCDRHFRQAGFHVLLDL